MQEEQYRGSIIEAVQLLEEIENSLFTAMVNIGMYGVHKDIHQSFEVGDAFTFELGMFENTGDANLDNLIGLIKSTAESRMALMNLNAIKDEEVSGPDDDYDE